MKAKVLIPGIVALIASSCSSGRVASYAAYEDDVYYNPKAANRPVATTSYRSSALPVANVAADSYTATSPIYDAGMSDYERYRLALESGQTVEEATAGVKSAPVEYYDAPAGDNRVQQYAYVETTQARDKQGNTYITNNYYDDSYAARIYRFDRPYIGFSYYDP